MKGFKLLIIWTIIGIVLELPIFYYFNNFYSSSSTSFKNEMISEHKEKVENKDIKIKIPQDADDIRTSFDNKYVSYYQKDNLEIVNTSDGNIIKVEPNKGGKISYYKWLPDNDRIIIAEKSNESRKNVLRFYSFDASKNDKKQIIDFDNQVLKINLSDKKGNVEDIALSTLSHTMYIKVSSGGKRGELYLVNVMNQIEKMKTNTYLIGNIALLENSDNLLYESLGKGRIVSYSDKSYIKTDSKLKIKLLGVDEKEKIYLGEIKDDKVIKIFSGDLKTPFSNWSTISLSRGFEQKSIFITKSGDIFINYSLEGYIYNTKNSKKISYKGRLVDIVDNKIISVYDDVLTKKSME